MKRDLMKDFIHIDNFINKIRNTLLNNRVSNFVKEVFEIGMDYPLLMFCDSTQEWVACLVDGKTEEGYPCTDITLSDSMDYASDFRKLRKGVRRRLLKKVNNIFSGQRVFRFRGIITYSGDAKNVG